MIRLSYVLKQFRWAEKLDVRSLAKQIGTSAATLSRYERGGDCDGNTLAKILNWLLAAQGQKN